MSVLYMWLCAGVALFILEAIGISGIGLMFAGFGSLITGIALSVGLLNEDSVTAQWIVFGIGTALSAVLLWRPIQKLRVGKHHGHYSNIVGDTAYVGSNGISKRDGEVTWSGTIMKAMLVPDSAIDRLEAGEQVVIVDIKGTTLHVKPKH